MSRSSSAALLATVAALLALAFGCYQARRHFVGSWFRVGEPVELPASSEPATCPAAARPLRALLVDGLGAEAAARMPRLKKVCDAGISLRVDVGWPSVSLPVQHALWTGTWQTQSGVMFAIKRLPRPAYETLQQRLSACSFTSVAVAQSHAEIVRSFPFTRIDAPAEPKGRLDHAELSRRALAAARSSEQLAFIHLLSVDRAGHRHGASSSQYKKEVERADELVGALWRARQPSWTFAVLSDHGHLPGGGHGGPEAQLRWVRACVAGPGLPSGRRADATIVDLTRVLAERLRVSPPARSQGRPMAKILRGTPPSQPLEGVPLLQRWLLLAAAAVFIGWLLLARRSTRSALDAQYALPWAPLLVGVATVASLGAVSLSRAHVYPSLPADLGGPAMLGVAVLGAQIWRLTRSGTPLLAASWSVALGLLLPPLVLLGLCGWPARVPPLVPQLSAWASTAVGVSGLLLLGLALAALVFRFSPLGPARASGRPPAARGR